jgi:transposase-like protein
MALHVFVFVFLLVVCLLLSLSLLWRLDWVHLRPSSTRGEVKRTTVQRLLKPRSPDDCPACRLGSTPSLGGEPGPAPVRPWHEIKSRRGAPKRVNTDGFACPNRKCPYFGITEASIHALVGDGKHGRTEPIQTFRCQACRTTFTSRRNTALYRLKTPSQQIAMVLSALAEGLDPSAAERVFGFRHATISTWLSCAGKHAQTFHERSFCHLWLPHLQLDELRIRLRSSTHLLWLWLAIDPRTKLVPVLYLGPRMQHAAHMVIHSLCQMLAPGCLLLFTSDGLTLYFYALTAHFGHWLQVRRRGRNVQKTAGGGWSDLRPGEKMLLAAQAGAGHTRDASRGTGRFQGLLAGDGLLGTAEYRFYRRGESDGPPWRLSAGTPHLGHCPAVSTAPGSRGMVARLLSFCASPRSTTSSARAAARTRWQAPGATLSATNSGDGSRENYPTME